MKRKEKKYILE